MTLQPVHTDGAPEAIGPYSQAVVVGNAAAGGLVFCSGQVALDPGTGELVGETAAEQAERSLRNLRAVVEAAGSGMDRVVRTTVYLASMEDFQAVNEVYAVHFPGVKPARACIAAKDAAEERPGGDRLHRPAVIGCRPVVWSLVADSRRRR